MVSNSHGLRRDLQTTVFLDTNVLHNIVLYLEYALEQDGLLFPFSHDSLFDEISIENSIDKIKEIELGDVDRGYKDGLLRGLQTIKHLREKECLINYSILSEMELLGGRIAGQVRVKLASQSTPNRIWSRIGQDSFRDRISFDELLAVNDAIDRLMQHTQRLGINMRRVLRENVAELAREISGFIYMSPIDSIIYASALDIECDYLITHDGYLRRTINLVSGTYNSNLTGDEIEKYRRIRDHIQKVSSVYLSREPAMLKMPEAIAISVDGKDSRD